jgi:hypothetical protein
VTIRWTCFVATLLAPLAVSAEKAEDWSRPEHGLQARLSFASKETINGTPIVVPYLELRNVSDVAMEIPLKPDRIEATVLDAARKPLEPATGPYDGPEPVFGLIWLPVDGTLRWSIARRGAGVPNDQRGLIDLGRTWIFKPKDKRVFFMRIRFVVEPTRGRTWAGTVEIPPTRISVLR